MSARGRRGGGGEHGGDERWLLTYADMITLLMALFIVMWSISSVNISRFDQLKASLKSAFSGKVLPANNSILTGQQAPFDQDGTPIQPPVPNEPSQAIQAPSIQANIAASIQQAQTQQETDSLKKVAEEVKAYAQAHGLQGVVQEKILERGLVVRLLTDKVLFTSGQATLRPEAFGLLGDIAHLLAAPDIPNNVRVEGNTDSQPIHSAQFPSNWELSSARADAVLEFLLSHGVQAHRLSATGYGDVNPIASNASEAGRATNRRVEIVILRRSFNTPTTEGP